MRESLGMRLCQATLYSIFRALTRLPHQVSINNFHVSGLEIRQKHIFCHCRCCHHCHSYSHLRTRYSKRGFITHDYKGSIMWGHPLGRMCFSQYPFRSVSSCRVSHQTCHNSIKCHSKPEVPYIY